jgi:hypothetical protein
MTLQEEFLRELVKYSLSRHTPGPWETGGVMTLVQVRPEGWNVPLCIADCHTKNAPENEAERCANAALISAAPELLAACERALPWIGKLIADGGHMASVAPNDAVRAMQMLEAAIKKAGGKL